MFRKWCLTFGLTKHRILKDILPHHIFEKLRNGDEYPLYEMYRLYRDEFLAWSKKQFNTTDEQAKDAFQDAMLDFHQNVLTGRLTELTSSLKTYIFQIGKHKILNIQKKESRLTYHDALHMINNGEVDYHHPIVNAAANLSISISNEGDELFGNYGQNKLYLFKKV